MKTSKAKQKLSPWAERDRTRQLATARAWLAEEAAKAGYVQRMVKDLFGAPFGSDKMPNSHRILEATRILERSIQK